VCEHGTAAEAAQCDLERDVPTLAYQLVVEEGNVGEDTQLIDSAGAAESLLEELRKPEYREPFLKSMKTGLHAGQRHCLRLYAEMHKLVGTQRELAVLVFNQLGVRDEREARSKIAAAREVENLDADSKWEAALDYVLTEGHALNRLPEALVRLEQLMPRGARSTPVVDGFPSAAGEAQEHEPHAAPAGSHTKSLDIRDTSPPEAA